MRLINADNFKTQVAAAAISNGFIQASEKAKVMIDLIDMQPTAFDVDKVVEQLETLVKEYDERIERRNGDCYYDEIKKIKALDERARGVEKAIEIVKKGGISCDVCEWKLDGDNLMTGCGDYFNLYDNCTEKFKYCPVCGKKIKVVE